ncbi:MAG TPA: GIDE domain-containing protein [Candidatus Acidoferrales bacterium]|nr:GIDE domain-containing protein [Candidatus Acidoferrales bacterium]
MASDPRFWGVAALLILGGFVLWFSSLRRIRRLRDTPTARIRSAAQGVVELVGQVRPLPGEHLASPMSGAPAVWWDCTVARRDENTLGRRRWSSVAQRRSDAAFLLDDGTGACIVHPEGAEVTAQVRIWYGQTPWPRGGPAGKRWAWLGDAPYRYTEKLLPTGHSVYVLGEFRTRRASDGDNPRAALAAMLAQWKRDPVALRERFDRNGDGQIDQDEWELARTAARAELDALRAQRADQPAVDAIVKPEDGSSYLLSVLTERQMVAQARWMAVLGFGMGLGGLLLIASAIR